MSSFLLVCATTVKLLFLCKMFLWSWNILTYHIWYHMHRIYSSLTHVGVLHMYITVRKTHAMRRQPIMQPIDNTNLLTCGSVLSIIQILMWCFNEHCPSLQVHGERSSQRKGCCEVAG